MRKITVDEDVWAVLERHPRWSQDPNAVLRIMLGLDDEKSVPNSAPVAPSDYTSGKLMDLVRDGLLEPGDALVHLRAHLHRTYRAVVEADGWVATEIKRHQSPSAALGELVGSPVNGWGGWVHERSDRTLRELREGRLTLRLAPASRPSQRTGQPRAQRGRHGRSHRPCRRGSARPDRRRDRAGPSLRGHPRPCRHRDRRPGHAVDVDWLEDPPEHLRPRSANRLRPLPAGRRLVGGRLRRLASSSSAWRG